VTRGYGSSAPRLADFDGSVWMLAHSRRYTFASRLTSNAPSVRAVIARRSRFWTGRAEALTRLARTARDGT
jgi:hypothetical protein